MFRRNLLRKGCTPRGRTPIERGPNTTMNDQEPSGSDRPSDPDGRSHRYPVVDLNELDEPLAESPTPLCQVRGCDRPGAVPRRLRTPQSDEPVMRHYVCTFHHRLFLWGKIAIFAIVVLLALYAFFTL